MRALFRSGTDGKTVGDTRWNFNGINNGLVAYYPFNGNANDESGNGNNGTIFGGTILTSDRFGNPNKAYSFNGTDAYILIPSSSSLESPQTGFAVTGWIYINSWDNGWAPFICKTMNTTGNKQYEVLLNQSYIGFYTSNYPSVSDSVPFAFQLSRWYFITVSWNGSTLNVYVDNNLVGTKYAPGTLIPDQNPLVFGINPPGSIEHLNGSLDDIRIYNRALSAAEINALYQEGGWTGNTNPIAPPASWNFTSTTGKNASIAVPTSINPRIGTQALHTGDAIGVFFLRNDSLICAGYSLWQAGQNMAITAWGDNSQTALKDGFAEGELIQFKIWDSQAGKEYNATAQYSTGGTTYATNGIYALSSLVGITSISHSIVLPQGWNMISSYCSTE